LITRDDTDQNIGMHKKTHTRTLGQYETIQLAADRTVHPNLVLETPTSTRRLEIQRSSSGGRY
jgi:hypothetical protein